MGTQLHADGNLLLSAGRDVKGTAAALSAGQVLAIDAGRDIKLLAGEATQSHDIATFSAGKSGGGNKITKTQRLSGDSTTAVGTSLEGQKVIVQAGRDLQLKGANVIGDEDVFLSAARNLAIEAAQNTNSERSFEQKTHQGLSTSGMSVTYGKREQSVDQRSDSTTVAASTVGSIGGNVVIRAGGAYTQIGSDILAPGGSIDILGKSGKVLEAGEANSQTSEQRSKQRGITLAITSPVISGVQAAQKQVQAAGQTKSSRMQALAVANAALNLKQSADALSAMQAKPQETAPPDGKPKEDQGSGIGISVSIGGSSSKSRQTSTAASDRGSNILAGGDVRIQATGAGEASNLTVRGSDIKAGGTAALLADNKVSLLAAANSGTERNTNSSASGSVGVAIQATRNGVGVGYTASASLGKGSGQGSSTSYANTHVQGQFVVIESGGDTTLGGAVVSADKVRARIGGDLVVQSLQDTSDYHERGKQVGGSVTIGVGGGGSLSAGSTRIDSRFRSVGEQSAIRAGDGGFDIEVQGTTSLVGGQITSTEQAVREGANVFVGKGGVTTTDLQNTASYSARSVSVGLGTGTPKPGASATAGLSGVGYGSDKGSASSITTAGISGVAGDRAARTGDASTGLKPIFDKDQVRAEVNAQVAITSEFGKQASKAVGDYAAARLSEAEKNTDQAGIDAWKEGGTARTALHTVVGGLTGGVAGAVGAAAGSAASPVLAQMQGQLASGLQAAGVNATVAIGIAGLASGATAAGVGGAVGGTAGAATAFNAEMNNRQLHAAEERWLKDKAKDFARQEGISEKQALERLTQQALRGVDYLWRAQLADGDDARAKAFLASNEQTFTNDLGQQQKLFTATGQQSLRPEMFADSASPDFYKQFAHSGISRDLNSGLVKELKDSGIDIGNGAIDLAQKARDNPGLVANAVWEAVKGLPQAVVDGLTESGIAIGEGAAVALNPDLAAKLGAIYGTDTLGAQRALLGIRMATGIGGSIGTAKATINAADEAAAAVAKKLDAALDQKATDGLMKSGGVFDKSGNPLLDLRQLSDAQKGVMGELFGANTVKQIVPDGQKIARMPMVGETGIDDLYKVNRPDVDYVVIEYKFVGDDKRLGSSALKNTADGRQASESWVAGSDRLERSVGKATAEAIDEAINAGRIETWVVTTRADGSTYAQVLDSAGRSKPINTSRIFVPIKNISGAMP